MFVYISGCGYRSCTGCQGCLPLCADKRLPLVDYRWLVEFAFLCYRIKKVIFKKSRYDCRWRNITLSKSTTHCCSEILITSKARVLYTRALLVGGHNPPTRTERFLLSIKHCPLLSTLIDGREFFQLQAVKMLLSSNAQRDVGSVNFKEIAAVDFCASSS